MSPARWLGFFGCDVGAETMGLWQWWKVVLLTQPSDGS